MKRPLHPCTSAILVYIALFGGVEVLGLAGLIIDPILMALAVASLRLYFREKQSRQST